MQLLFPSLVSVIYKICQTKNYYLRQLCRIGHFCFCFIAICVLFANQRPAIYFSLTIYSILVSWRKLEQFSPGVRRVHPGEVSVCGTHRLPDCLVTFCNQTVKRFLQILFFLNCDHFPVVPLVYDILPGLQIVLCCPLMKVFAN